MISDVLHDALRKIGEYLDEFPDAYSGDLREMIDDLSGHMGEVMQVLDTPPVTSGELVH